MERNQVQSLQEEIYNYIYHRIRIGSLQPGQKLTEATIAKETGISRSPIREAFRRLISEGLIIKDTRGGVRVYRAGFEEFKHLYECRESIEPKAAYLAAQRMNEVQKVNFQHLMNEKNKLIEEKDITNLKLVSGRFHELIAEGSGNFYLIKMLRQLNGLLMFYRNEVLDISQRMESGAIEHNAIWQAILKENELEAEEKMRKHIQMDYEFYKANYENQANHMKMND